MDINEAREYFHDDDIGRLCIELASESNAKQNFGAVLVANDEILGAGRNHRSTPEERAKLFGIDYAVHAEEAAILDADMGQRDDQVIFVIGRINQGKEKGALNIRTDERGYTCLRCAKKLVAFEAQVAIPTLDGWRFIAPEDAMAEASSHRSSGSKRNFV